jgi:hypothetical protein
MKREDDLKNLGVDIGKISESFLKFMTVEIRLSSLRTEDGGKLL